MIKAKVAFLEGRLLSS